MLTVNYIQSCLKDKSGAHTLDNLWEDTVTRKLLRDIAKYTRKKCATGQKSTKSKSSRALIDLRTVRKIDPPPAQTLFRWLNDSASFPAIESSADVRPKSLRHAYDVTVALEDNNLSSTIALRFFHLLFFDVGKHLEPTKTTVNSALAIGVANQLIALGLDKVDLGRLKGWILIGSIYNDLIEAFGEGCLFFLPTEIGLARWLLLGLKTPEVITHLDVIRIRNWIEKFKTDGQGRNIRQSLLSPVLNNFQIGLNQVRGLPVGVGRVLNETCRTLPPPAPGPSLAMIRQSEQRHLTNTTQVSANITNYTTSSQFQHGLPSTETTEETQDWIAASDFPLLDFTPASSFNFMSAAYTEML